jgi:hypothetical protein
VWAGKAASLQSTGRCPASEQLLGGAADQPKHYLRAENDRCEIMGGIKQTMETALPKYCSDILVFSKPTLRSKWGYDGKDLEISTQ